MMKKMRTTKKTNKIFRFLLAFLFLFNVGFSSTNSVFAKASNFIHVHLSDNVGVTSVQVVWKGFTYDLSNPGDSKTYSVSDDKEFASSDITKVLINGIEVQYTVGTEGGGTVNLWATFAAAPAMTITKVADVGTAKAKDTITYTITVTNTGNVALKGVVVSDPLIPFTETINLAVGAHQDFVKTYVVPEDQAGDIENTATATVENISVQATAIVEYIPPEGSGDIPGLSITKISDVDSAYRGDTITYTITVTNTGNVDLEGVVVSDPLIPFTETINLAVGAHQDFVKTYLVSDIQAYGKLTNTATATCTEVDPVTATKDVTILERQTVVKGYSITKTSDVESAYRGDTITYTITVTNTGNVALEGVVVSDPKIPFTETVNIAAGAHQDFVKTYLVSDSQAYGKLTNTATATYQGLPQINATKDVTILERQAPMPDFSITKISNVDTARSGDTIRYTITVTNTGNVALTNVNVTDSLVNLDETINLAVGAHQDFVKDYIVPDNQDGDIENTAIATWGEGSKDATVIVELLPPLGPGETPGLSIIKTVDKTTAKVGDTLKYTITVKNIGNVDLTNVLVKDTMLGLNETIALLEADETKTFTKTYVIPDGTAIGNLINTATATAIFEEETVSATDTATTKVEPTIIEEDETPTGTLPQTGGIPFGDLAVLGSGLAALGFLLRRKQ